MAKSKKQHVIPQQSYLSDDLIVEEILTRLPVKSIIRFKSVSKQWYSTLSSSDFANAQLIKSPFPHPSTPIDTLFIKCGENCYIFSYDDADQLCANFEDNLVKLDVDFGVDFGVGKDHLELTGCCNGLICLTQCYGEYFILWNPATSKLHKYESDGYSKRFDGLNCPYVFYGFGYASNIDDYKYVRILLEWGNPESTIVHIFSLRENRWREIDFVHDPPLVYRNAVPVDYKLYWAAIWDQIGDSVVSFDLRNEKFEISSIDCDVLGVMGGRLSTCSCTGKLMNILEPPSILKSICLPKGFKLDISSQMLGFTKADKFFVTDPLNDEGGSGSRTLGLVDTRTKPMQYTTLLRFDKCFKIAIYFPSLVSPFPIIEPLEA